MVPMAGKQARVSGSHGLERDGGKASTPAQTCLLDQQAAAKLLGLQPATLSWWRTTARGPRFIRISNRAVRYRPEDIEVFIAELAVEPAKHVSGARSASRSDGEPVDVAVCSARGRS